VIKIRKLPPRSTLGVPFASRVTTITFFFELPIASTSTPTAAAVATRLIIATNVDRNYFGISILSASGSRRHAFSWRNGFKIVSWVPRTRALGRRIFAMESQYFTDLSSRIFPEQTFRLLFMAAIACVHTGPTMQPLHHGANENTSIWGTSTLPGMLHGRLLLQPIIANLSTFDWYLLL